ncbi:hypothetical protein BJF93_21055 [Xaviernesmea oryzae]|uniref:EamA domain-containing protein n=2 Tax=Xaviernesmea oryzae TaxID=464029 RepID=A0A1Q9AZX7_9HYPH|nr:DMT family transporter [Xaviernesmea oryzae]OLP61273.1 hypothetical protein BJF93_21055 [Xaviernesmea oryzae]SEL53063.1 S-adenosylmethionine uptake transporter [Xaviernesmea oryzae]
MSSINAVARRDDTPLGLTFMVLSVLVSPVIDVFSKLAVVTVPAGEVAFSRFVLQAALLLPPVLMRRALRGVGARTMALHALRGGLLVVSMLSFVATLKVMELADAIAIFFVEPIILTILGGIFLKETIGWRRYTACAVGFLGAMLVIQPSFREVGPMALLPMISALAIAIFLLVTRRVAKSEDPWSMQFYAGIWGAIFAGALLILGAGMDIEVIGPVMPDATTLLYLLGTGVSATIASVLGVYAYRAAPASVLAPLQYLEIVSATLFGWLVFDQLPDTLKWLGIAIIIASGLYIIWREHRLKRAAMPVPPAI